MKTIHNKLVRDNIPELICEAGGTVAYRQLDMPSFLEALDNKLTEEVQEYLSDKNLEEMADILEVLFALCKARGYTAEELLEKREQKARERGGFEKRIFLEYVEDMPEPKKHHYAHKVKLNDVLEGMEFASEDFQYFYNARTEEVIMYADSMLTGEDDSELEADMEENWEDYYPLPGKFEIDEYSMMEEFIRSLPDGKARNRLESAIRGKGAFRRFKDAVADLGLEEKWYEYRDGAYVKVAKEWCEKNGIECVE